MCCTAKEKLIFSYWQTFLLPFRWFNYLAEILLIFGRNKLCPLFVDFTIGHNPFQPLAWRTKRGRKQSVERDFGKSASCHISVYRPYFLRYGFQQDNFQYFSLLVFSFLGSGRKSRIVCRWRSRSYSGGDKSLTRLPPTPPTRLTKPKEKYTPACQSKSERQTSYLSFSVVVFYRWLLHARFINTYLHLSDCVACNQIFYFSSESVSFPFTSISMRSSPYRIRWSFPFRRKGNSGILRCCKVGAFGFGENLHTYAPLRFASGSIFPQKPCIRSSLPLWGTWNENDRCDRKTH